MCLLPSSYVIESVTDSAPVAFVPSKLPVLLPNLISNMLLVSDTTEFLILTNDDSASGMVFLFSRLATDPLVFILLFLGLLDLANDSSLTLTVLLLDVE